MSVPALAWAERAACAKVDPEVMFPHPSDRAGLAVARRVCQGCPVLDDCARYADAVQRDHPLHGMWAARYRGSSSRPRVFTCAVCGVTFEHPGQGAPLTCSPVCAARRAAAKAAARAATRPGSAHA